MTLYTASPPKIKILDRTLPPVPSCGLCNVMSLSTVNLEIGCVTAERMRQEDVGKCLLSSTRQLLCLAIEKPWSTLCTNGLRKCSSRFVRAINFGTVGHFLMWESACWSRALTVGNEQVDLKLRIFWSNFTYYIIVH